MAVVQPLRRLTLRISPGIWHICRSNFEKKKIRGTDIYKEGNSAAWVTKKHKETPVSEESQGFHFWFISISISEVTMKHRAIFLFLFFLKTCEATQQCKTTSSVYGHYLNGHVISSMSAAGPGPCHRICDKDPKCKSMNFRLENKSCELNNADRFSHPQDYQERQSSVYSDTSEPLKGVSVTLMTSQDICILNVV